MDVVSIFRDLLFDYTLRTVALGSALLGLVSGVLGVFAVLRRQSLLGDAISHAALPGVALAFLITGSKEPLVLALGAIAAGWLATVLVLQVTGNTRIKPDAALGIALAVFFGFGLLLLTFIQRLPNAARPGSTSSSSARPRRCSAATSSRWPRSAAPRCCWSCSSGKSSSC